MIDFKLNALLVQIGPPSWSLTTPGINSSVQRRFCGTSRHCHSCKVGKTRSQLLPYVPYRIYENVS
jgi:hypothetical protein